MKFESEKHYYNYCKKVISSKDFEFKFEDNELKNNCSKIYNFGCKNELPIKNKYLIPINIIYRDFLSNAESEEKLQFSFSLADGLIILYNNMLNMDILSIATSQRYRAFMTSEFLFYTDEFINNLTKLNNRSGVYKLYDKNQKLIYIGKSYNLSNRLMSSIDERKANYCTYSIIDNKANTDLYEVYYINKLNPILNTDCNSGNELTITLPEIEFAPLTKIYREVMN